MRIAVGSDEATDLTAAVIKDLQEQGHELRLFGPLAGDEGEWAAVSIAVAEDVASGQRDQGVLFCWTGTGSSIAANKVRGIRAALCADAETARGARKWNHANVLVMSLRLTSEITAREILEAWLATSDGTEDFDVRNVEIIRQLEIQKTY